MGTSMNLKEATAQYIQHLEQTGQKPSTLGTAKRTLDLLIADMGEDTIGNPTPQTIPASAMMNTYQCQPQP